MYWAKQIIGWVADPVTALDYCLRLNNRWELDAVDPNSYAGVIWNFGRHDQGWTERPIWGKVRYMNESGLKRKFNMAAYVAKVDLLVRKHGLPQAISQLRDSRKRRYVQSTLDESPESAKPRKSSKRK
jgi:deoxyribodipyrimidine photo-lyase